MYSELIHRFSSELRTAAGVAEGPHPLLDDTFAAFLDSFASRIGARFYPSGDLGLLGVRLVLLADSIVRSQQMAPPGLHYLIGMGFEHTAAISDPSALRPIDDDRWLTLSLSLFNYLSGGFRLQALTVLRALERERDSHGSTAAGAYGEAYQALRAIYDGRQLRSSGPTPLWRNILVTRATIADPRERLLRDLARRLSARDSSLANALGLENPSGFLEASGVPTTEDTRDFWSRYVESVRQRGLALSPPIAPETLREWLHASKHLLVGLPTGAGKSLIGELRTALALASGGLVVWLLPTRALVRQVKRDLRRAFVDQDVVIEELPTTEDVLPAFSEALSGDRVIAVTTPERFLALLRANGQAAAGLAALVVDEAHLVFDRNRGAALESVLSQVKVLFDAARLVLMSGDLVRIGALGRLLDAMDVARAELKSDLRPTRRVYGVIHSENVGHIRRPVLRLFPPGAGLGEESADEAPVVLLGRERATKGLDAATKLVAAAARGGVRSVMFVETKKSAKSRARKIAKKGRLRALPDLDLARLNVELGRASEVVQTAKFGVAAHHADLQKLEQHIVEKWIRDGFLEAVTATPTLAQGVNLPFDMSIVTFVARYDDRDDTRVPLTPFEVQNMLGRAGRAGMVGDGLCLMSAEPGESDALGNRRAWFFPTPLSDYSVPGLAALLLRLRYISDPTAWIHELGGFTLGEVQSLLAFTSQNIDTAAEAGESLINVLAALPSFALLPQSERTVVIAVVANIATALRTAIGQSAELRQMVIKTGLPVEFASAVLERIPTGAVLPWELPELEQLEFVDSCVWETLAALRARAWIAALLEKHPIERLRAFVTAWRNGDTVAAAEAASRIGHQSGSVINQVLPTFSPLWGGVAVGCALLNPQLPRNSALALAPALTREGASTLVQLAWLRAVGDLDRVLAHQLADVLPAPAGVANIRAWARERLRDVADGTRAVDGLSEASGLALEGVVLELFG